MGIISPSYIDGNDGINVNNYNNVKIKTKNILQEKTISISIDFSDPDYSMIGPMVVSQKIHPIEMNMFKRMDESIKKEMATTKISQCNANGKSNGFTMFKTDKILIKNLKISSFCVGCDCRLNYNIQPVKSSKTVCYNVNEENSGNCDGDSIRRTQSNENILLDKIAVNVSKKHQVLYELQESDEFIRTFGLSTRFFKIRNLSAISKTTIEILPTDILFITYCNNFVLFQEYLEIMGVVGKNSNVLEKTNFIIIKEGDTFRIKERGLFWLQEFLKEKVFDKFRFQTLGDIKLELLFFLPDMKKKKKKKRLTPWRGEINSNSDRIKEVKRIMGMNNNVSQNRNDSILSSSKMKFQVCFTLTYYQITQGDKINSFVYKIPKKSTG